MGQALQVVTGSALAPGAAPVALTVAPGDSFTVKSFDPPAVARLLNAWASSATAGIARIRSPRMHDPNQGLRLQVPAAQQAELLPRYLQAPLYSVDNLTVELAGGGAGETDILSYLVYYSDLAGINANLAGWNEIQDRIVAYCGVEVDLVSGATAGQYGGSRALNLDFQNLKADISYALLGYTCKTGFATLGITGPDTGNLRIGGPGSANPDITADWFVRLSQFAGLPLIPIIKANNQATTIVDIASTDTATAHTVSLLLAQLSS